MFLPKRSNGPSAEGNPTSVVRGINLSYVYDALGRRISKTFIGEVCGISSVDGVLSVSQPKDLAVLPIYRIASSNRGDSSGVGSVLDIKLFATETGGLHGYGLAKLALIITAAESQN